MGLVFPPFEWLFHEPRVYWDPPFFDLGGQDISTDASRQFFENSLQVHGILSTDDCYNIPLHQSHKKQFWGEEQPSLDILWGVGLLSFEVLKKVLCYYSINLSDFLFHPVPLLPDTNNGIRLWSIYIIPKDPHPNLFLRQSNHLHLRSLGRFEKRCDHDIGDQLLIKCLPELALLPEYLGCHQLDLSILLGSKRSRHTVI